MLLDKWMPQPRFVLWVILACYVAACAYHLAVCPSYCMKPILEIDCNTLRKHMRCYAFARQAAAQQPVGHLTGKCAVHPAPSACCCYRYRYRTS